MDMLTCNLSDLPIEDFSVGTMGSLLNAYYTADDMGRDSGTIGYEILTSLGQRYHRIYIEE